jgi:hypothetical protein
MKVTIYSTSDFMGNVVKTEATLISISKKDYAQYKDCPQVTFLPKGKRKGGYCLRATYDPYLLVIEGWGHPEPADLFNEGVKSETGLTVKHSRYMSFDKGYKTDFDQVINEHLKTCNVLLDCRATERTEKVILFPFVQEAKKVLIIEKENIDINTGAKVCFNAEVQNEQDEQHPIYSLLYEGYRSEWKEVVKIEETKYFNEKGVQLFI